MKILHYSLGLPPYRSGGLTKYSTDLAIEQTKENKVFFLFAGEFNVCSKNTKICFDLEWNKIKVFKIINPLPVSLLNGIKDVNMYIKKTNKDIFYDFFQKYEFDIIHIHTFMGLHREFLEIAKILKIKIVYTTHDYFGLCPKVNLFDSNDNICLRENYLKCIECNRQAYSKKKCIILQSKFFRKIKSYSSFDKMRCFKLKRQSNDRILREKKVNLDYNILFNYYETMFNYIDEFIFNSSVTKEVYQKNLNVNGQVIPITHSGIKIKKKIKNTNIGKPLKISFLGSSQKYKGLEFLLEILYELTKKQVNNFEFNIYGPVCNSKYKFHNVKFHGKYSYEDLESIYENTDLLVVPSQCKETFGFVALEAIAHSVPVIVTKNVGFKDIILKDKPLGFAVSNNELLLVLKNIIEDREILQQINKNIRNADLEEFKIEAHEKKIREIYEK